jgi:hypothetical protein
MFQISQKLVDRQPPAPIPLPLIQPPLSPFIKGEGGQGVVPKGGRGVVGKGDVKREE